MYYTYIENVVLALLVVEFFFKFSDVRGGFPKNFVFCGAEQSPEVNAIFSSMQAKKKNAFAC